ncbi:universal stress protein [Lentzea flaviverrucosa]|uniref:Nucleotide-binding universal stress protein, UspA family n=1 Tax=Lentzea flaviverrucosa TaxID=200379 RepID=A0A1H9XWD7_9PSEU|nr:universal stress protein [Lentzea flaviverrucosa]RDI34331.1 nucleotide-binding universal stress UspA family protein [Lentzea flaviverrucosa]SES50498.1 Nucleotide-binding universal stress protein, UspA family [Lentzea flaviverrucosa]
MTTENAPIVVGVDGSPASEQALRWAMGEASLRNCPLHVVHAWTFEPLVDWYETNAQNQLTLSETLVDTSVRAALVGRLQPPEIERRSLRGDAAEVLEEASKGAALLVVASHTVSRLRQITMGSTSMHCVRHSSVPVVVIPVNEHSASNET